ncbi:DUF998 domain-containing protein [Psychromicrobium lacuslunae]|uniref:DUF998 domain-containing protein n=1 Tax=Psychromicrobium lacuslunae TaxID=1618207 RepID=A0A0D4C298_9MICC|nr:DUF998 domain-containing protein [Psychromicrobium lacuslunae]AJT42664.1 hypothetical protein UM93_16450 [Psychromicrobium lacuslunae]
MQNIVRKLRYADFMMASSNSQIRNLFGAWAVMSVVQVFLAEAVVAAAWAGNQPYSAIFNVISDLGAAHCGIHNTRYLCSPLNWLMNASLGLQGAGMILGGLLLSSSLLGVAAKLNSAQPAQLTAAAWVRWLLVISGAGVVLLAIFPEDTIAVLHFIGAMSFFGAGTIALLLLWWIWYQRSALSWLLLALGLISGLATVSFTIFTLLLKVPNFADGLIERLIVYPLIIGLAVVGLMVARGVRQQRRLARAQSEG